MGMEIRVEQILDYSGTLISKSGYFELNYQNDIFEIINPTAAQELLSIRDGAITADMLYAPSVGDGLQIALNTGAGIPRSTNVLTVNCIAPLHIVGSSGVGGGAGVGGVVALNLFPLGGLELDGGQLRVGVKPVDVGGLICNGGGRLAISFPPSGSIGPTVNGVELAWITQNPGMVDGVVYVPTLERNAGVYTFNVVDALGTMNQVRVTSADLVPDFLYNSILVGPGLTRTVVNPGANEVFGLSLSLSSSVNVNGFGDLVIPLNGVEGPMILGSAIAPGHVQAGATYPIDVASVDGASVGVGAFDIWLGTTIQDLVADAVEYLVDPVDIMTVAAPGDPAPNAPFDPRPGDGYRIVALTGGVDSLGFVFNANDIYQYDAVAGTWLHTVALVGMSLFNLDDLRVYCFNGVGWDVYSFVTELNDLTDVAIAGPVDDLSLLQYNAGIFSWTPVPGYAADGITLSLDPVTNVLSANVGVAFGVAGLDVTGRIPASQLTLSALEYHGTWNATTNVPVLIDGTGTQGDFYIVAVGGTRNLGSGDIVFAEGDWVLYNGATWERSLNSITAWSQIDMTGSSLGDIADVTIVGAVAGEVLTWDGAVWANVAIPAPAVPAFEDLTNVTIVGVGVSDVVRWDGAAWVNSEFIDNVTVVGNTTIPVGTVVNAFDYTCTGILTIEGTLNVANKLTTPSLVVSGGRLDARSVELTGIINPTVLENAHVDKLVSNVAAEVILAVGVTIVSVNMLLGLMLSTVASSNCMVSNAVVGTFTWDDAAGPLLASLILWVTAFSATSPQAQVLGHAQYV